VTYSAILVCLGLAAVGCTSPSGQETQAPPTTAVPDNQSPEDSQPENTPETDSNTPPNFGQADPALSDLTGQLAISTDTGELWVMAPDGFGPELVAGGNGSRANQPTWLKNSSALAYSYFDASVQGIGYFGIEAEDDPFSDVPGNPIYYLHWSPAGTDVAFLRTAPDQRNTEFGLARPAEEGQTLASGAPFFLSWSLDSSTLAAHVDNQRVDLWDVSERSVETLFETETRFVAPSYLTPSALLSARDGAMGLTSVSTGTTISILGRTGGQVRFVPSPDGTLVAYAGGDEDRDLKIVEVATGSTIVVTPDVGLAWEWSSDSSRLAWLGANELGLGQWHFFDVETGIEVGTSQPYSPTSFVRSSILPFFAQYALSHNRWSPDGTGFAYAGQAADGLTGIWVELVEGNSGATLVSPGNFVTWSQNDVASGGGRNPF
jgi:hypothetical protein